MPKKTASRGKKTTGRTKKTTAKKSTAKKTSAAAKARKSAEKEAGISTALVKKVLKARQNGESWGEIRENLGIKKNQINPIRKAMRELDPDSVQASGPRGEGRQRSRKKAESEGSEKKTKKKSSKKKGSKKRRKSSASSEEKTTRRRKRGGRGKAQRLNLAELDDSALLEALTGREITFALNTVDRKPTSKVVRSAKMLPENEKFGRIVQIKTTDARTHSIAVDWIQKVR